MTRTCGQTPSAPISAGPAVYIGFHHGDLGIAVAPDPAPDLIDAKLAQPDQPSRWLDLRSDDMRRLWGGPAKARVISGIYDASRDSAEYMAVASLTDAFDVLVHLHELPPRNGCPER